MRRCHNSLLVAGAILVLIAVAGAGAQSPGPQTSGLDITGAWYSGGASMEGGAQTELVDYSGLPLSEAGRLYALAWDPSRWTSRQQQYMAYEPTRLLHGGGNFRFWEERDPTTQRLIAIKFYGQITEGTRTVWMDGRPHPPAYAKHSFLGFSTGKYEGNVLTVYTTHLKRNYIRTNGVAMSDQTTLVEHFIRHGDRVTYITVLTDPVYLTEPLVRNSDMRRSVRNPEAWLYACDDGEQILGRPDDQVPNYLFGQNPFLREHADKYHIPLLGALGGPETLYPDYREKLASATEADAIARTRPRPNAPAIASRAVDPDPHDGEIHVWPVQGNVYMLIGDGGNIAVQTGEQGALVVDTGAGKLAAKTGGHQEAGWRQADSVYRQHQLPSGAHRRKRNSPRGGFGSQPSRFIFLSRSTVVQRCRCWGDDHRAQQRAEPHECAYRSGGADAIGRMAERHVSSRPQAEALQR